MSFEGLREIAALFLYLTPTRVAGRGAVPHALPVHNVCRRYGVDAEGLLHRSAHLLYGTPATEAQRAEIARIAKALEKHRKDAQLHHPEITLTQMYNVLQKVRAAKVPLPRFADPPQRGGTGSSITPDDCEGKARNESLPTGEGARRAGEVPSLTPDEKLIFANALPKQPRVLCAGLRPEYQIPRFGSDAEKKQLEAFDDVEQVPAAAAKTVKPNFPSNAVDQVAAVMAALALYDDNVSAAE